MATADDGVTWLPRVEERPWDPDDASDPFFTVADVEQLKQGQRRLCQQMGAVTVERTERVIVAIGARHGRWLALRWTEGRLNGLAFSTRSGTWGTWTNIADCAAKFARALLLDGDAKLRDRLLAEMAQLDQPNDRAPRLWRRRRGGDEPRRSRHDRRAGETCGPPPAG